MARGSGGARLATLKCESPSSDVISDREPSSRVSWIGMGSSNCRGAFGQSAARPGHPPIYTALGITWSPAAIPSAQANAAPEARLTWMGANVLSWTALVHMQD